MTEAMGHGVNQRRAIRMTPEEVDAFLAERRAVVAQPSANRLPAHHGLHNGGEREAEDQCPQDLPRHGSTDGQRMADGVHPSHDADPLVSK